MVAKRPILIVEDDPALRETLVEQLSDNSEFQPIAAATLVEAMSYLERETTRTDLIVLDLGLPDGDGQTFCAQLRRQGHHMPIIMLTGTGGEADIVRGLQNGANDYVCKPFRMAELQARIRAQLRAFDASENATFSIGPYIFRPAARSLVGQSDGRKIHLSAKETALLRCLLRVEGAAIKREALMKAVWDYSSGTASHTLETHIYRLRRKIEVDPGNPQLLLVSSGGYRLIADLNVPDQALRTEGSGRDPGMGRETVGAGKTWRHEAAPPSSASS
jgi:DNA-binding response OmpR family regulator